MEQPRTFLFLQGPHGPFFPRLGAELARQGHRVHRINFNGGDATTWPGGGSYRGTSAAWPNYVRRFMAREGTTDLLLYGDARPLHASAIDVARVLGVRVHVFEEGYIRPDWVTLERNGVNGYSTLPRDPAWYRREAEHLPPLAEYPPLPGFSSTREWGALFYYIDVVLQHWRFPFHQGHRETSAVREAVAYLRRYIVKGRDRARSIASGSRLAGREFVLFPLQLDSDYQIRRHSPFGTIEAAIGHVMASFAAHAPATMMLAIKEHPLDVGVKNWRAVVSRLAEVMDVAERVVFLEQGDLEELIAAAKGVVTVNSTSGTLALAAGKPVKVLGDAVYGIAEITEQRPLDAFWADPMPPDAATYEAFCRVLGDRCLLPGAFLSEVGADRLIAAAAARVTAADER